MESFIPSLRVKTNELYFKWLSESDKRDQLKELIDLVKSGKQINLNNCQSLFFKEVSCV